MKKFNSALLISLISFASSAQVKLNVEKINGIPQNAFYTVGGEPFVNVKFVRLTSGTPYFRDQWMKGSGMSANGTGYKASALKLDLIDNVLHYLDNDGREMIATSDLQEVLLTDTVSNHTYHFVHSSAFPANSLIRQGWYQVLSAGKIGLYQYFLKTVSETTPYGSATAEQSITTKEEFYLMHNNNVQQLKKPKDLPGILTDKKPELEEFLKTNGKNKSITEQFTAMAKYYNSLH